MPSSRRGSHRHRSPRSDALQNLQWLLQAVFNKAAGRRQHGRPGKHSRTSGQPHAKRDSAGWLVRRPVTKAGLAVAAVAALALLWIAWRIVADTAAINLAAVAPETALRLNPKESSALVRLVEAEVGRPEGDLELAKQRAEDAFRANPLDHRALFYLGFIAERAGNREAADELARAAAARTRRHMTIQVWLFQRSIRQKDFIEAFDHFDAFYRVNFLNADVLQLLLPWLALITADPDGFRTMQEVLATNPPWRGWLLRTLSARLADEKRIEQLYVSLGKSEHPPTKEELRAYVGRLLTGQRFDVAYEMWIDTLDPGQRPDGRFPYNRDFKLPLDGLPFNWMLQSGSGADVRIVPLGEGANLGLRIQFAGARVSFLGRVKQLLRLPPGAYRLTGAVRAEELETTRGLWWRVFCAGGAGTELGHTDLVAKNMPWTEFSLNFRVSPGTEPGSECSAQWLQLELPARTGSENRIEGQIWYRPLRIEPVPELSLGGGGAPAQK